MSEVDQSNSQTSFEASQKQNGIPILEEVSSVTEEKRQEYRKNLRQYFLHGKKTNDSQVIEASKLWLSPFLQNVDTENDFPVLFDNENQEVTSLSHHLEETFIDTFDPEEAVALAQCLPRIISIVREYLDQLDPVLDYDFQIKEAFKALRQIKVDHPDPELFNKQCDQFESQLLSTKGILIPFSAFTAFQILNLQLEQQRVHNQGFINLLAKSISGLNEILMLQDEETDSSQSQYDFAQDLLSFDKIEGISTPKVSSSLPEERLNRLKQCHHILSKARKSYIDSYSTIFVTNDLANKFDLRNILKGSKLAVHSENPCGEARKHFKKEIHDFVQVIAALRLADLEINQKYNSELHAPYFEGFNRSYLSDDDIRYFRSLIVVEESDQLTHRPKDLLAMLSDGAFVKVLAVNSIDKIHDSIGTTDEGETYLELAALAIFRRNAYVFQGGADTPSLLNKAIHRGLNATSPVLWNILFTNPETKEKNAAFLTLKTAIESRYFPRIEYDIRTGVDFGSHFDLSGNTLPESYFLIVEREVKTKSDKTTQQYSLTTADFLAIDPDNLHLLEILPSWYESEDLISVDQYLSLSGDVAAGKIPIIWLMDDKNVLKRAAIPITWLQHCRSRLEYWHFLQELGGVKSSHLQQAVDKAKSEWEASKNSDLEALKTELNDTFEQTRKNDLEKSINKMLYALLNPDLDITQLDTQSNLVTDTKQEEVEISPQPKEKVGEQQVQEKAPVVKSEVWIESDLCTSCNDCTDALPGVFKYNDDKQAIVHNPKGGSYAKIVSTAEKCPAKCIHPGLPQDESEKGLEKLIKRAEKYN